MRAETAIFVVVFKKAVRDGEYWRSIEDFILLQESVIRGHHVFKEIWTPRHGEILLVNQEPGNASSLKDALLLC